MASKGRLKMTDNNLVELLGAEWELNYDFLGKVRHRNFDPVALERLLKLIKPLAHPHPRNQIALVVQNRIQNTQLFVLKCQYYFRLVN